MVQQKSHFILEVTIIILIATAWMLSNTAPAWSHGGKTHAGNGFSSLQAVQKATELYDRLITVQKLVEQWETQLKTITVSKRQSKGKHEFIVQFTREEGDPASVYFFFDEKGEYSGSNFTGR